MPTHPRILVHIVGGTVQAVDADTEVEVLVLDFDTDGLDPTALSGPATGRALVQTWHVAARPTQVGVIVDRYQPDETRV